MSQGFGNTRADRSLLHSTRELAALHKVLRKYANDEKGRKKMLKRLKKYYRGPLAELDRIDMKPVNMPKADEWLINEDDLPEAEEEIRNMEAADALRESLRKDSQLAQEVDKT